MADTPHAPTAPPRGAGTAPATPAPPSVPIGEVVQLVTEYAKQETLGPVRGAGRWLGYGIAGAICLGSGATLVVLGLLRLIQNEFAPTFAGRWMSLLPYVAALALCAVVIAIAVSRIMKTSLHDD